MKSKTLFEIRNSVKVERLACFTLRINIDRDEISIEFEKEFPRGSSNI